MYGVVLWSDPRQRQAVIWCEDHGDLAFFRDDAPSGYIGLAFEPGDLVVFTLTLEGRTRYAQDPYLVSEGAYRDLPARVRIAGGHPGSTGAAMAAPQAQTVADIVPLRILEPACCVEAPPRLRG